MAGESATGKRILEFVQGLFVGAGGILPGISGASLAVVFGFYRELTDLVAHPKQNARVFLARHWSLAIGIGVGFVATTVLLDRLFAAHERTIIYLFWGFIAGTIPSVWRGARKTGAGVREAISFALTAGALIAFSLLVGQGASGEALSLAPSGSASHADAIGPIEWILSGAIIGSGSLLPGVSASVILVYLGLYGPMLDAATRLALLPLALIGSGSLLAIALLSRAIAALYARFGGIVSFGILGFTLGSLILVFPGMPHLPAGVDPWSLPSALALSAAIVPAFAGLALSLFLGRRAA
jgi:putative membrane protein